MSALFKRITTPLGLATSLLASFIILWGVDNLQKSQELEVTPTTINLVASTPDSVQCMLKLIPQVGETLAKSFWVTPAMDSITLHFNLSLGQQKLMQVIWPAEVDIFQLKTITVGNHQRVVTMNPHSLIREMAFVDCRPQKKEDVLLLTPTGENPVLSYRYDLGLLLRYSGTRGSIVWVWMGLFFLLGGWTVWRVISKQHQE